MASVRWSQVVGGLLSAAIYSPTERGVQHAAGGGPAAAAVSVSSPHGVSTRKHLRSLSTLASASNSRNSLHMALSGSAASMPRPSAPCAERAAGDSSKTSRSD